MRQFDLVSLLLDAFGKFLDAFGNIPLGSVLLKVTLVLGLATAACALLHRQSAAFRHRIWVLALGVALALPLALLLPQFELHVLPGAVDSTLQDLTEARRVAQAPASIASAEITLPESEVEFSRQESALQVGMKTESTRVESATESQQNSMYETPPARIAERLGIGNLLVFIWLLGTTIASLLFVISLAIQTIQLSRLRRVNDDEWAASMNDAAKRLGIQRPILTLESDQACVPAVIGILSPRLVVPHDWRTWSLAQRTCILLHELAHVKRLDVSTQFIGRLALLAYWFHPLVWFAVRQLRAERELASDDCVLLAGPAASDYAEELLRTLRRYRPVRPAMGVAMAHSARLDQRVLAILDVRRCRNPLGKTTAIALLCLFGLLGGVFGGVTLASRLVEETTEDRFQFHPEPVTATDLKIGITAGKTVAVVVGPEKQKLGLKLEVTIKNESRAAIKTLLPREWHGGQWPPTALYAAVAPTGAKELAAYHPVYRFGESSAESRNVTIEADGTHKIEIRTDWPGTDTPAVPLIDKPGKYSAKFALVFEADGKQQVVESDVVTIEYSDMGEKKDKNGEKKPLTVKELHGKWHGGAENQFGLKKLATSLDFDFVGGERPFGDTRRDNYRWRLEYRREVGATGLGISGICEDDPTTGRVNIQFHFLTEDNKTGAIRYGYLSRGETGTILLTTLPAIRKQHEDAPVFEGLVLRREEGEKKPLTAKELKGKWFGEAENKDGIRKLVAHIDFDRVFGGDVHWRLRYETEESGGAEIGHTGHRVENAATGHVDLYFKKTVLGHLARGEGDTILLTILPEFEKKNMPGERVYRQFERLALRRMEEPNERVGDVKALQGTWTVLEERRPDPLEKDRAEQIKGGDLQWRFSGSKFAPARKGMQQDGWTDVYLDSSRSPKEMHTLEELSLFDRTRAVRSKFNYELKGDDLRVFGWVPRQGAEPAAPRDFDPKNYPGEKWTLTTLKRTTREEKKDSGQSKQGGNEGNPVPDAEGKVGGQAAPLGELTVVEITGAKDGKVWGTHTYTADSNIAVAAVHAGFATVGEKRVIAVEVVSAPKSFGGTTRNGITSLPYGEYPTAIRLYDITLRPARRANLPPIVAPPERVNDDGLERLLIQEDSIPSVMYDITLRPARRADLLPIVDPPEPASDADFNRLIRRINDGNDKSSVLVVREITGEDRVDVWGTDIYTGDSSLAAAAVHAGLLKVGETGWICREVVPTLKSYTGTTRNGVASNSYGKYPIAVKLRRVAGPAPAHRLAD